MFGVGSGLFGGVFTTLIWRDKRKTRTFHQVFSSYGYLLHYQVLKSWRH